MERLRTLNYKVLAASCGAEAIEIIEAGQVIELVFSDIAMPGGMSGFELADWLKRNHPAIPVLLSTGYADQLNAVKDDAAAAIAILRKPYSQNDLAQAVANALAGS